MSGKPTADGGWFAYGSDLVCPECGAEVVTEVLEPRVEQLKAWFMDGDRGRRTESSCENGHSWTAGGSSLPPSRLRGLWNALAFNRTVIPTPNSYAVAFGAGTITGLAAKHFGFRRWWSLPPVFVVASWGVALATAFRGPRRASSLRALRDQIDPTGAPARRDAVMRHMLDTCPFPAYALATDQPQPAELGSTTSGEDRVLRSVSVIHGDPARIGAPLVEVETSVEPIDHAIHSEAERLAYNAAADEHADPATGRLDPRALNAARRNRELLVDTEWVESRLTVDGLAVPSRRASMGDHHSEVAEVGPCTVVVRSRHTHPSRLRLARTDLTTYELR